MSIVKPIKVLLNVVIAPVIVIYLSITVVSKWIEMREPPRSRKPPQMTPRVALLESRPTEATPTIRTFGTVRSFYEAQLASQVGGEIVSVAPSFQSGVAVSEGEILVTINPADYQAAVASREAELASTREKLADEESRARIAKEDWIASGRSIDQAPEFTLRIPQLDAARKSVTSATAALENAQLDLERTQVRAPFDAIVQERTASPGNVVNPGEILGRLIARERSEVRLPLTPEQVARLGLPLSFHADGAPELEATLTTPSQPEATWAARITRTEPTINPQNQVIYVIAEIARPFDDPKAFLPVGAFVNATLSAAPLQGVHRLPEAALIEDRYVWVLDQDNCLRRQPVERLFGEDGTFLARIPDPVSPEPLRVATRPLVSFAEGESAEPLDPDAPRGRPGGGPGKGKGPGDGKRPGGREGRTPKPQE